MPLRPRRLPVREPLPASGGMVTMGIALGLLAAVAYGASDFIAGHGGRRASVGLITVIVQLAGVAAAVLAVAAFPGHGPDAAALWWGALSGVGSGSGTAMLYRGLARGQMSVVAPVSAVTTAALPALVGVLLGERLSALALTGVVLAMPAIALVSWSPRSATVRITDVAYGLVAGCGFALLFVALHQAGTDAGAWPLVPGQGIAVLVVAMPALREVHRRDAWRHTLRPGLGAGAVGGAANLLYLAATGAGQLTIIAVLTSLYPAFTVLLAMTVLHERLAATQTLGLVNAGAAITLIVLG